MTKRVKTSAVLKYAYDRIKGRWEDYICIAVETYDWGDMPEVKRALRLIRTRMQMGSFEKWVDKQRAGCWYDDPYVCCETSLEWWLVWKGHVKVSAMPTKEQMRTYRLAWLDALIQECEAKGD